MKTRVLSLVLALIMVVSMAAVFSVSSSAEDAKINVVVGTAYAAPGTTATVEIFVSATELDETYAQLRNWQFTFSGLALSGAEDLKPYVSGKLPSGTENLTNNEAMNSSDAGENCGTAEQVLTRGGWCIGTIGFTVPEDAEVGAEIELTITKVTALSFETAELVATDERDNVGIVPGKVVVVSSDEGVADEVVGAGEKYVIPTINAASEYVFDIGENVSGEFDTLTIPASVTETFKLGRKTTKFDNITALTNLVLKGADIDEGELDYIFTLAENASEDGINVFYHQKATKDGTTAAALEALEGEDKEFLNPQNILKAEAQAFPTATGIAFVGGLTVADFDYEGGLTIVIEAAGKVKEYTSKNIYKTVKGVASVDPEKAAAANVPVLEGFEYIFAVNVKGMPSDVGEVKVTVYAYTPDALGTPICVCSDTVTI